jgi:hypothetical protein
MCKISSIAGSRAMAGNSRRFRLIANRDNDHQNRYNQTLAAQNALIKIVR